MGGSSWRAVEDRILNYVAINNYCIINKIKNMAYGQTAFNRTVTASPITAKTLSASLPNILTIYI
jgi:hypothetical protein